MSGVERTEGSRGARSARAQTLRVATLEANEGPDLEECSIDASPRSATLLASRWSLPVAASVLCASLLMPSGSGTIAGAMKSASQLATESGAANAVPSTSRASTTPRSSTPLQGRVPLPEAPAGVLFGDLDGDGREDPVVVYGSQDGDCTLARVVRAGDGLGLRTIPSPGGTHLHAPALGDVDGDGIADLLEASSGRVTMWRGLGTGAFDPEPRLLHASEELILPEEGCSRAPAYYQDVEGDDRPELVLPLAGGVRVVPIAAMGDAGSAQRPRDDAGAVLVDPHQSTPHASGTIPAAPPEDTPHDLLTQPSVHGGEGGLSLRSALPVILGLGRRRILVLGPILDPGSRRLEMSWWSQDEDGRPRGRRSALSLPAGERAALALPCDLEGDGRPEVAVLTVPSRLQKLLGEFGLSVYRASDTAMTPVKPFFSATTDINYWQRPFMALRPATGGGDLLVAFYRGLVKEHLNVMIFRSNGSGSFQPRPHEIGLEAGEKPDEGLLLWKDVDGDGTLDLAAADSRGLRIHRGLADREAPVERSPSRVGALASPLGQTRLLSLSLSGDWTIAFRGVTEPVIRDLDGDGVAEAFVIERTRSVRGRPQGDNALSVRPLVPGVR